jgi:hypothetical protein
MRTATHHITRDRITNMTDKTNEIAFFKNGDCQGWGHALWFGTHSDKGWVLECDMKGGAITAALTPAGTDPLFLFTASGPAEDGAQETRVSITVERDGAVWNPATRTLTFSDVEADGYADTDPLEDLLSAAQAALDCILKHVPATTFAPRDRLRAAIARAKA